MLQNTSHDKKKGFKMSEENITEAPETSAVEEEQEEQAFQEVVEVSWKITQQSFSYRWKKEECQ